MLGLTSWGYINGAHLKAKIPKQRTTTKYFKLITEATHALYCLFTHFVAFQAFSWFSPHVWSIVEITGYLQFLLSSKRIETECDLFQNEPLVVKWKPVYCRVILLTAPHWGRNFLKIFKMFQCCFNTVEYALSCTSCSSQACYFDWKKQMYQLNIINIIGATSRFQVQRP